MPIWETCRKYIFAWFKWTRRAASLDDGMRRPQAVEFKPNSHPVMVDRSGPTATHGPTETFEPLSPMPATPTQVESAMTQHSPVKLPPPNPNFSNLINFFGCGIFFCVCTSNIHRCRAVQLLLLYESGPCGVYMPISCVFLFLLFLITYLRGKFRMSVDNRRSDRASVTLGVVGCSGSLAFRFA